MHISQKVQNIKPSITLTLAAQAIALRAQGKDIINMGVGEPDFDTPDFIKEAAISALKAGFTKYTAVDGVFDLKQAIVAKFARENGLNYEAKQILVSSGAKQSLSNALTALLDAGDEVVIPAPYWVSYPDMVRLAEGTPVIVSTDSAAGFKLSADQLEAAITPRTRALILNSPANPSGAVYTHKELKALAAVLLQHPHIFIITDDIYEHIRWTSEDFANLVMMAPELYDRTIVVNGVSKAYAMTGWRIGYAAGHADMISAMRKVQSQTTSCPNAMAQMAAKAALAGGLLPVRKMVSAYKARHDHLINRVADIPHLHAVPADGTFYALLCAKEIIAHHNFKDDVAFCNFLLEKAQVSLVPGSGFGIPNYVRISYATSISQLDKALDRISAAMLSLT